MIAIASDHAGIELKKIITDFLDKNNEQYKDFGATDKISTDYPDYALIVSESVANGEYTKGILICGTGVGMCISANKVKGIRAAFCGDTFTANASRAHNDANILCIGERITGPGIALNIVDTWLHTEFEGGRHRTRVDKILQIENKYMK